MLLYIPTNGEFKRAGGRGPFLKNIDLLKKKSSDKKKAKILNLKYMGCFNKLKFIS